MCCTVFALSETENEEACAITMEEESKAKKLIEEFNDSRKISIQKAHEILGHMGEDRTRKICNHVGIELS